MGEEGGGAGRVMRRGRRKVEGERARGREREETYSMETMSVPEGHSFRT